MELILIISAASLVFYVHGQELSCLFVSAYCSHEDFNASGVMESLTSSSVNDSSQFFRINTVYTDSSMRDNLHVMLDALVHSGPQLSVIHPGCVGDNEVLADIIEFFNTTIISFAFSGSSTSPHPNHVRMLPSERHLGEGVVAVVKYYRWKTMHVFSEDYPAFQSILTVIENEVNITHSTLSSTPQIEFPANNKIILLNMFPRDARKVICEALKHNDSFFSSLVWISYEWHDSEWWTSSGGECEDKHVERALNRMLVVSHHPYSEEDYLSEFASSKYEQYISDTVRTLNVGVENYRGINIRDYVDNISFMGVSGFVSFENGIRQLEEVSIKVYRDNSLVRVATVAIQANRSFHYETNESHESVWGEPVPPWDGVPVRKINPPLLPLLVLCYIYCSLGIVFAFVCLIFNFAFRKKRLIQLTSPNLNYVVIAGALVMLCSSYTFFHLPGISDELLAAVCNLRVILLSTGVTLCYMPINAKMWRVYHICRKPDPSMKKILVKDWHLILLVLGIVAVEIVAFAVIVSIEPARYYPRVIPDKEHPGCHHINNITVKYYVRRCYSPAENYFLPVFIGSKVLLQFVGVLLAFSIRRVKIKGLNDSRQIAAILYVTTALIFIMAVIVFIYGDYINIDGVANSLNATTGALCVLILIFIPKMVSLYKDPKGERIFTRNDTHMRTQTENDQKMVVKAYEKRIKELESQLAENKTMELNNGLSDGTKEAQPC